MATYTNISLDEMTSFLTDPNFPGGPFTRVYPEGYTEAAFARRVPNDKLQLSLRVNSGIVGEDSRDVGKDAIRVSLYWRQQAGDRPRHGWHRHRWRNHWVRHGADAGNGGRNGVHAATGSRGQDRPGHLHRPEEHLTGKRLSTV